MKTVIAVSIDTNLAKQLERKTKGTRSRTVERALRAYLDGESDYSIQDVETKILATVLMTRLQRENDWNHTPLSMMLMELRESL